MIAPEFNKIQILEKIIENDGSCNWAKPSICKKCPLAKLSRSESGIWLSCVDAVLGDKSTLIKEEDKIDSLYLEIAKKTLLSELIDNILKDDNGSVANKD